MTQQSKCDFYIVIILFKHFCDDYIASHSANNILRMFKMTRNDRAYARANSSVS